MSKDNDSVSDKTPNVWIDPAYLRYLEALELLTGRTPSEFVNVHIKDDIKIVFEEVLKSLPDYVEETAERPDIKL